MGEYITVGAFILLDIVTGLVKAMYKGNVNSSTLRIGLYHKISEVLAIAVSGVLEYYTGKLDFGFDLHILGVVSVYICITELISILENISAVNPKLAVLFKPYLEKLNNRKNEGSDKDGSDN